MYLVALETTERIGSIALFEDDRLVATQSLAPDQRSAQSLLVGLRDVVADQDWRMDEVSLIAVARGPGSFTGLRVGVTAAKTLAYALGAGVLGISTLDALATVCPVDAEDPEKPESPQALWCLLDAQRRQIFAAKYVVESGRFVPKVAMGTFDIDAWIARLEPGDRVAGPPLAKLSERLGEQVSILDQRYWAPTAESVGRLAWDQYQAGRRDDVWQFVPDYVRRSAAEEQRDAVAADRDDTE